MAKDMQRRCPVCGRTVGTVWIKSLNRVYYNFHTTKPHGKETCRRSRQPVDARPLPAHET